MKSLFICLIFLISLLNAEIIRDSSREVVTDTRNNLMWQDSEDNVLILKKHSQAKEYCEELNFAGFTNWRLPTIKEFELIVDKTNIINYINKAFKYNLPQGYWASDTLWRTFHFYAYYMNFVSGTPYYYNKDYEKYVRCVRSFG